METVKKNDYRLLSFGHGCQIESITRGNRPSESSGEVLLDMPDTQLVSSLYQYGRYLMLSSSSRQVSNLQGLWSDGLSSAWNGDYHLNINLEMNYWGLGGANFKENYHPLLAFIEKLQKLGSFTAKEMYGQNQAVDNGAWITHGFVDSTLDGFPFADLQWSLCVTCGAWIATHLYDMILYERFDGKFIVERILPVFRGIARFFISYLFEKNQMIHSGPTGSPENSYRKTISLNSHAKLQSIEILTLSPAIDVSILRQVRAIDCLSVDSLN
jgi:alpha-L-fucosidase 2